MARPAIITGKVIMKYIVFSFASLCYVSSLFLPVFIWSHSNPHVDYGYDVLISGWIGILGLVPGWYSNPLMIASLVYYFRGRRGQDVLTPVSYPLSEPPNEQPSPDLLYFKRLKLAKVCAFWALILASSSWFVNHNGNFRLQSVGLGFYLWNFSIFFVCGYTIYCVWSKERKLFI
jgi:hypothetical protein